MASFGSVAWLHQMMADYGLWILFAMVFLESAGVPIPGETALITAALYAGSTHHFSLIEVICVAFAAAVAGDTMAYAIGRTLGLRLLTRYGKYVRLPERRLKVGEYLFWRHGGKIVFFGRFVALLRVLAALLAGANRMEWPRFAAMNALGGLCWATLVASAAYFVGGRIRTAERPIAFGLSIAVVTVIAIGLVAYRRFEKELEERALAHFSDRLARVGDAATP
jgi:membrane protein DedA with SNARE-associated domain